MGEEQQIALPGISDRPIGEAFAVFCKADPHSSMEALISERAYAAIVDAPMIARFKIVLAQFARAFGSVFFAGSLILTVEYSAAALTAFLSLGVLGWSLSVLRRKYEPTTSELYELADTENQRQNIRRLEEFRTNIRAGYFKMVEDVAVPSKKTTLGRTLSPALIAGDHGRLVILSDAPFNAIRTFSRKPFGPVRIQRGNQLSATLLTSKELLNMQDKVQFAARIDFLKKASKDHPRSVEFNAWLDVLKTAYSGKQNEYGFEAIVAECKADGNNVGSLNNLKKLSTNRSTPFLTILKEIDLHGLPPAERNPPNS